MYFLENIASRTFNIRIAQPLNNEEVSNFENEHDYTSIIPRHPTDRIYKTKNKGTQRRKQVKFYTLQRCVTINAIKRVNMLKDNSSKFFVFDIVICVYQSCINVSAKCSCQYSRVLTSVIAQLVVGYFRNIETYKSKKIKLHFLIKDVVCLKIPNCIYYI